MTLLQSEERQRPDWVQLKGMGFRSGRQGEGRGGLRLRGVESYRASEAKVGSLGFTLRDKRSHRRVLNKSGES